MRYVLYGLPCAGKTTLLNGLNGIRTVCGSETLRQLSGGRFSQMNAAERNTVRKAYTEYLKSLDDETIVSDGHYSFLDEVVFTKADAEVYDVFLYLYCPPELLRERYCLSEKNSKYAALTIERIEEWQASEIESLRNECHSRNKDFYVVRYGEISPELLSEFVAAIENGFSSFALAEQLVDRIAARYPTPCELHLVDGDKTFINEDSFRLSTGNYKVKAFDGNFYTGFQSWLFAGEVRKLSFDYGKLDEVSLNETVRDRLKGKEFVILSAGVSELWERLADKFGISTWFADTHISADTKYYVTKLLRWKGYRIVAYGDSRNDLYMLREADEGFLYIGGRMSSSLQMTDTRGVKLMYSKQPFFLAESGLIADADRRNIAVCRSDSGINGSALAWAHFSLGKTLGRYVGTLVPDSGTAILVLERGGRFFGEGFYCTFGGTFYPYNPKKECLPAIKEQHIIIVDSVINTGSSILGVINAIRELRSDAEIFVAANVIQERAVDTLRDFRLFSVRRSQNSYVGRNQKQQDGKYGPDTADRLYNLIGSVTSNG